MVDYGRAVKRPFGDIKKLLIGTVLQLIPVVNIISMGYQLKCAKTAMSKKFEMPEWEEWGDLFANGLMMVVAGIVYLIPAMMAVGFGIGAGLFRGGLGAMTSGDINPLTVALGLGTGALVASILALCAIYILPSAMLNFAKGGRFGDLFAIKTICQKALKVDYLTVWVATAVYTVVATVVLSILPAVGTAFGGFVAAVTSYTLFGEVYEKL